MSKLIESPHFKRLKQCLESGWWIRSTRRLAIRLDRLVTGDRRDSFLLSCGLVCYLGALGGLSYLGGLGVFMQISDRLNCTKWNYNSCSWVRVLRKHRSGFQAACWTTKTSCLSSLLGDHWTVACIDRPDNERWIYRLWATWQQWSSSANDR